MKLQGIASDLMISVVLYDPSKYIRAIVHDLSPTSKTMVLQTASAGEGEKFGV